MYGVGNGQLPDRRKATMPTVVYIGDKLKEVRTRRLLTQIELAEKASVNHSTIVNIERNQVEPHFRTIRKLAQALDVDPTKLLGE
jgi:transcriptional regulator with XRE-family HTH domain